MIGTDIIEIERAAEAAKNPAFLKRIFCEEEIAYIKARGNAPQTIAGLFAAKEAVIKACGGAAGFKDVLITHNEKGMPSATVKGKHAAVSISHCKTYATAVAILTTNLNGEK